MIGDPAVPSRARPSGRCSYRKCNHRFGLEPFYWPTIQGPGRHLDYYLDEYTFRFNRRNSRSRGLIFYRLMQQAMVTPPVSYRQIVNSPDHNI